VQGVHRQVEVLDFPTKEVVEEFLLQGVHRRGRHYITRGYLERHKECVQRILEIHEFAIETKIRRDRDFEGIE
jgi:hypothetical protein